MKKSQLKKKLSLEAFKMRTASSSPEKALQAIIGGTEDGCHLKPAEPTFTPESDDWGEL